VKDPINIYNGTVQKYKARTEVTISLCPAWWTD